MIENVEDKPTTVSGQIIALHDRGYDLKQIVLELRSQPGLGKVDLRRVKHVIQMYTGRSLDSRRIAEIHDAALELLAIGRQLLSLKQRQDIASRTRAVEKELAERERVLVNQPLSRGRPAGS